MGDTADLAEHWKSSGQQLRMPDGHMCWAIDAVQLSAGDVDYDVSRLVSK